MLTGKLGSNTVSEVPALSDNLNRVAVARMIWLNRWVGVGIAISIAILFGMLMAILMPRGPISSTDALVLMGLGAVTGVIAGFFMRSGWAVALVPAVHLITFEIGRIGTDGPLVDGLRFDSTWGIAAIILGRGIYLVLGILPIIAGASIGIWIARFFSGTSENLVSRSATVRYYARRAILALTIAGLLILALALIRPASTPAILADTGEELQGSIAVLEKVEIGNSEQWIMIRGHDVNKPVLLSLAGGPGGTDLAYSRVLLSEVEKDFVVVSWDQRGVGKSYASLDPVSSMTPEQAVADTAELTNYLRQRFDEDKIYLMGESWGSILGIMTVREHPDLFHAYIGTGQMVSPKATDQLLYQDMLDYAARTGDTGLADTMLAFGQPPYDDLFAYAFVMGYYETLQPFTPLPETARTVEDAGIGMLGIMAQEYSLMDKLNVARGLIDTFSVMYPQLQEIDFREDAAELEIPVYLIHGKYELDARGELVLEYFDVLEAPRKLLVEFEYGSHAPAFDDPERFHDLLVDTVLPETYPQSVAARSVASEGHNLGTPSSLRSYVDRDQTTPGLTNQ